MKGAIQKKIVYISEKYIKTVFFMGFKNHIRHMATVPATPHKGIEEQRHKDLPHFEGHCAGCSGGRKVGQVSSVGWALPCRPPHIKAQRPKDVEMWEIFLKPIKNCFMYISEIHIQYIYNFFLDSFFHFLYLFKMWEIFMPHPV